MGNSHRTVQCASAGCQRTFKCGARTPVHYCPQCRLARLRKSKRRFKQTKRQAKFEPPYDPDSDLNQKLEAAEFSVLHDAGPPDLAFRRGAKLGAWELHYMLKDKSIAENSTLLNTHTQTRHRVTHDLRGRLNLDPPCVLIEESA